MPEPRIWILPADVAERIAAGEVVERPASVVKELVENSLDAGARRITVETEAGGKALIRVTDDGQGMTPEETRIALHRHATSKLRTSDDLFNIHTLGFRGEAIPSIAAVSEMEILTRTPDADEGTRLVVRGGAVVAEGPAAANVGTSITVRQLFFNVPVREKFLRSDAAEAGQITDWLQRLALAHGDVSFRLVHDGREALLSAGSQEPLNAVVAVLGRAIARDLIRVSPLAVEAGGEAGITVTGFVGRPTLTRANRGLQHFYVNGRAVRSPLFYRALDDAFRSTLPQGRNPVAVILIEVAPDMVDVNVHPAKTEVRFQDEGAVHRAVLRAVQFALRGDPGTASVAPGLPTGEVSTPGEPPPFRVGEPSAVAAPPATPTGPLPFAEAALGGPLPHERRESGSRWQPGSGTPRPADFDPFEDDEQHGRPASARPMPSARTFPEAGRAWEPSRPASERPTASFELPTPRPPAVPAVAPTLDAPPAAAGTARGNWPELNLLGQVHDLFILVEGGGRLWVIDQHVAHERVLFDQMTAAGTREAAEPLLIPPTLDVDRPHALALQEHREILAELGFEVEPFGSSRFRLVGVPRSLIGRDYESAFRDLADDLAERSAGGQTRLRKEEVALAAAGRSCKRAIKAGQPLSHAEMERLLEQLASTRNPHTCPHGRPVFLTWEEAEIHALFGDHTCERS